MTYSGKFADPVYKDGTVAWIIERYIKDTSSPEMKEIGASKLYTLRVIQRSELGRKSATGLKKNDVIDYCRELRKRLSASTVNQYLCFLGGVLEYAVSAWDDCENVAFTAIEARVRFSSSTRSSASPCHGPACRPTRSWKRIEATTRRRTSAARSA
jgi:hypothetical protein